MSSVYPGRIQGGRTMDRRMNNEYSYLNKNKGRGSRISAPFPHLRVMMLIGADWWLVIGDWWYRDENFGIPSRWIFFSTSSSPSKMYQNTNTPSDTAATPQLLRGVFASKLGCCCFDRWNAGWNLHNEEARGVWMEFVRKFHAQGICKEVTSPHAQTRTTLSRTMAAAYPRQQ